MAVITNGRQGEERADADRADPPSAPLDDVVVLDLSCGIAGQFAARLLGDWGATVVLVEPPTGAPTRRLPPFRREGERLEQSLLFWHLNTSKRSVCLDVTTPSGAAALDRLVEAADVVVSDRDGAVADLTMRMPRLVGCRLREFTAGGPYEAWTGSELVHQAMSGLMHTTGRADRAPLHGFGHRAAYSAGAAAAAGIMAALLERDRSGLGQLLDLSVHEVAVAMSQNLVTQHSYSGADPGRGRYMGACGVFRCTDGWIVLFCPTGRWAALCEALELRALGDDPRFRTYDQVVVRWAEAAVELQEALLARRVDDVVTAARRARSMAAKVYEPDDVVACEHLAARGYWQQVPVEGRTELALGPVHRMTDVELCVPGPAPRLGADTERWLDLADELRGAGAS